MGKGIKSSSNQHSTLSPSFLDNESIVFLLSCDVKKKSQKIYLIYNKVIIWFIFMLTIDLFEVDFLKIIHGGKCLIP